MSEQRILATGIVFGESPRWGPDGRMWFSDWGTQEVIAVDDDGRSEVVVSLGGSFQPICIDWLPDGRLLVVSGRDQAVLRVEPDGSVANHADLSTLPERVGNEIVVDGRGRAYVNGADFDLMAGEEPRPGTIALVTPDGGARQVADGLGFPNGMAITPDGSALICAESYGRRLTAYDIGDDGALANAHTWADLGDGVPDGICLDAEGAVWYADVPNRRCVRVREGGEVLQTIELDRGAFSCALGGEDGRTLYIVGQEWRGTDGAATGKRSGQVVAVRAPAPAARSSTQ